MKTNKLREMLNNGEPTLSTHIHSTWPSVVEAIGHTGLYDYVEFVAEYGSFDLHELDNICRTAELHNMASMIKVDRSAQEFLAQRGIGAGFSSVLFTDTRSADDVRECIRIARPDTPEDNGLYGVATRRNTYMGYGGNKDYVQILRDTVIAFMIEKKGAVEELDEILELPGVEMVQWGGSDYSMSIGRVGERNHPDVVAARNKVGHRQGHTRARRDPVRRAGQGVPRHGRASLLDRHGHIHPLQFLERERREAAEGHVGRLASTSPLPSLGEGWSLT